MTSFQSKLGDDEEEVADDEPEAVSAPDPLATEDTLAADELAERQREISIAEFFERNKQMLGFGSDARALVTAVKEAVDNALDATEEAGILPDLYVEIQETDGYYQLIVEDNGPGITKEQIPKVFGKLLYGSRFHARRQSRGQQGIGISAAVLHSQLTSGKPARITSRPKGRDEARYFELIIDTDENEPEIKADEAVSWDRPHGTRIELEMEANMRARGQLRDYVKQTAVVNPHARIEFREPDAEFKFERATDQLPPETEEIAPHPHGVELGTLLKLLDGTSSRTISGFLKGEFTRVGATTADNVIDAFRDRHFGREMAWSPPAAHEDVDVAAAVEDAVANKPADVTATFATTVADRIEDHEQIAHHEVESIVTETADEIADEYDTTLGATVRERAVEAAWNAITADRRSDCYRLVNEATSVQKDDATVEGLADRLAGRFGEGDGRDRLTHDDLAKLVDRAADMLETGLEVTFGETARENVIEAFWEEMRPVPDDPPAVRTVAGDRTIARDLLEGMRKTDIMAPPTDCLAPIGEELIEEGLKKEFDADFYASTTRDAGVHGGDPFVVEAGIAYGGEIDDDGGVDLLRFANRVPLVYKRGGCATTDVMSDIGWRNYNLDQPGGRGLPNGPAVILVHVASTNVPFTSESKDAVASVPEIEDEIELAVREAARDLKDYLNRRQSLQQRQRKQNAIATILPEMATKLAEVTDRKPPNYDDALARIMNNVLVEREREDGLVRLTVENHTGRGETVEITDIVDEKPTALSDGAAAVEVDGEWFVRWEVEVPSGEDAAIEYELSEDATCDVRVQGVETAKLTVNA